MPRISGFNSRSREGSDGNVGRDPERKGEFQFTLPRGERQLLLLSHVGYLLGFNSRSREGSDDTFVCMMLISLGFNSRSREGSDLTYR